MKWILLPILLFASTLIGQENFTLDGQLIYEDADLSDIWGWEKDGREYAIVGKKNGISVVDVTVGESAEELYLIPGSFSIWRDIKTYNNHAYIVDDQAGEALIIIDLNDAPNSFTHTVWMPETDTFSSTECHNIYIEEATGYAYLLGCNNTVTDSEIQELSIVLDLKDDPKDPVIAGIYTDRYVHDAYVRNDTMYTSEIEEGNFSIVDFRDKENPLVLARQETSGSQTHNCWLSDDGNLLFTTDEIAEGFVDVYDISDFSDIQLLDKIQPSPGLQVIPHNTFVLGQWIITSWYTEGVLIHDFSDPENLIEVGHFDTAPLYSGIGFDGAWGVYPYLPSGRVLVTDIQTGLWVLEPNYVAAARLGVTVTDEETGLAIPDAIVQVEALGISTSTNIFGEVEIGGGSSGAFVLQVGASNYETQQFENVSFVSGEKTEISISLQPSQAIELNFLVVADGLTVNNANIRLESLNDSFEGKTDASGALKFVDFPSNTYTYYVGKWGYETEVFETTYIGIDEGVKILELHDRIYEDDFVFDLGWDLIVENSDGNWEVGIPEGTDVNGIPANPGVDIQTDYGAGCLVTGAEAGVVNGQNEIDEGDPSVVRSPSFDMSEMEDPVISFYRWFADLNTGAPNDTLLIELSNGMETVLVDSCTAQNPQASEWAFREFAVSDYLAPSSQMRLQLSIKDVPGSNVLEGALDVFRAYDRNGTFDLSGIISEEPGWPLAAATIELLNADTGESTSATSDFNGAYRIAELTAGTYSATVSKPNFQEASFGDIEISALDDVRNFSLVRLLSVTNVDEESSLSIAPNPCKEIIQLSLSQQVDPEQVVKTEIFNLDGQLVFQSKGLTKEIDVTSWNSGVYLVQLALKNQRQIRSRVLKQ